MPNPFKNMSQIILNNKGVINPEDLLFDEKKLGEGHFGDVYSGRYIGNDPEVLKVCSPLLNKNNQLILDETGKPIYYFVLKTPKQDPNASVEDNKQVMESFVSEQECVDNLSKNATFKDGEPPAYNMGSGGVIIDASGQKQPIIFNQLEINEVADKKPLSSTVAKFFRAESFNKLNKDRETLSLSLMANMYNHSIKDLHAKKWLHLDIATRNFLVKTEYKEGEIISFDSKIIDFGLAKNLAFENRLIKSIQEQTSLSELIKVVRNYADETKNKRLGQIATFLENTPIEFNNAKQLAGKEVEDAILYDATFHEAISISETGNVPIAWMNQKRLKREAIDESADLHAFKVTFLETIAYQLGYTTELQFINLFPSPIADFIRTNDDIETLTFVYQKLMNELELKKQESPQLQATIDYLSHFKEYLTQSHANPQADAQAFNDSMFVYFEKQLQKEFTQINETHNVKDFLLSIKRLMALTSSIDKDKLSKGARDRYEFFQEACKNLNDFPLDQKMIDANLAKFSFSNEPSNEVNLQDEIRKMQGSLSIYFEKEIPPYKAFSAEHTLPHDILISKIANDKEYQADKNLLVDSYVASIDDMANSIITHEKHIFSKMTTDDFFKAHLNSRDKNPSPLMIESAHFFNGLSKYVIENILKCKDLKTRTLTMEYWINVAERLLKHPELNDQNAAFAIYSALGSASISRLKGTFASLSDEGKAKYDFLNKVLVPTENDKKPREYLKENPVTIPKLAITGHDVQFGLDGNTALIKATSVQTVAPMYKAAKSFQNNIEIIKATSTKNASIPGLIENINALKDKNQNGFDKIMYVVSSSEIIEPRDVAITPTPIAQQREKDFQPAIKNSRKNEKALTVPATKILYKDHSDIKNLPEKLFNGDKNINPFEISPEEKAAAALTFIKNNNDKFSKTSDQQLQQLTELRNSQTNLTTRRNDLQKQNTDKPNDTTKNQLAEAESQLKEIENQINPLNLIESLKSNNIHLAAEFFKELDLQSYLKIMTSPSQPESPINHFEYLKKLPLINDMITSTEFLNNLVVKKDSQALTEWLAQPSPTNPSASIYDTLPDTVKTRLQEVLPLTHYTNKSLFTRKETVNHAKNIATFVTDNLMDHLDGKPSQAILAKKGNDVYVISSHSHETHMGVDVSKQELANLKKNQYSLRTATGDSKQYHQEAIKKTMDKINKSILFKSKSEKGFLYDLENQTALTLNQGQFGRLGTPYNQLPREFIVSDDHISMLEKQSKIDLNPKIDETMDKVAQTYDMQGLLEFAKYVGMDVADYRTKIETRENMLNPGLKTTALKNLKTELTSDIKIFLKDKMKLRQTSLENHILNLKISQVIDKHTNHHSLAFKKEIGTLIKENPSFFIKGDFQLYGKDQSSMIFGRMLKTTGVQKDLIRTLNNEVDENIQAIIKDTNDPRMIEQVLANKRLREIFSPTDLEQRYQALLNNEYNKIKIPDASKLIDGNNEAKLNEAKLQNTMQQADLSHQIAAEILNEPSVANRALMVTRWVNLMERAKATGENLTATAIQHALTQTPVKDLHKTMGSLSYQTTADLKNLKTDEVALAAISKARPPLPRISAKAIEPTSTHRSDILKDKKVFNVTRRAGAPQFKRFLFRHFHLPDFKRRKTATVDLPAAVVANSPAAAAPIAAKADPELVVDNPMYQPMPAQRENTYQPIPVLEQKAVAPQPEVPVNLTAELATLRELSDSVNKILEKLKKHMDENNIPLPPQPAEASNDHHFAEYNRGIRA